MTSSRRQPDETARALRLSLAWTLAVYGWLVRREAVGFVSGMSFLVDNSWDKARGGDDFAEPLRWVMLAVVVLGLLFEMLPGRLARSAGLSLLLFFPTQTVINVVFSLFAGQLPTPTRLAHGLAMNLTMFALFSDPTLQARSLLLGPGVGLLLAAVLGSWALPRFVPRLSPR